MTEPIPEPLHGADVISWAQPVTRALNALRDKVGAKARNERDRRPTQQPQPFEVRWDNSLNSGSGGYKIYLPSGHLLSYEDEDIATSDISGATVIQDGDGNNTPWFSLDDIDTSADHVWLVVTVSDPESEGNSPTVEAEFSSSEGQPQTGENVIDVCIAEIDYTEPEDEGSAPTVKISQSVVGAIRLSPAGQEPDDVSIDNNGGEDENKLQIAHFNDTEKDSGRGLANRLRANTETGEITSDTSNLMLVARRNGEVVYIPLSGNGTDPDDESPDSGGKDPCEHPGGGGGASPDDDGGGHGGGGMGGGDGGGGVLADGDTHIGDNGCNCE